MDWKSEIKDLIAKALDELGFDVPEEIGLERTSNPQFGDVSSNVAMVMFSRLQATGDKQQAFKSPRELGEAIVNKIHDSRFKNNEVIVRIEVAGPGFVNFWLSDEFLIDNLAKVLEEKDDYGKAPAFAKATVGKQKNKSTKAQKQRVVVEHTSPNPNKSMHLGHLRNNVTGMAIANVLEANGNEVIRDCIDNNRGIAIAKLMWGYLKFARKSEEVPVDVGYWFEHRDDWKQPEDEGLRPDRFVDELYVKGSDDFKGNEEIVRQMVVDWEAEDEKVWALWELVLGFSYAGQKMTLDRLGNKWDKVWHEHEHYKEGKVLVEKGIEKGVFRKLDDGAVVTDLAKFDLSDTIVTKSDGTALYITQDLALTKLKRETYGADQLYWVIGPEQSLAMRQMFAACEQLGIGKYEDYHHVAYGAMRIKGEGKMSSRKGNVVYIDELLDEARDRVKGLIKNEDLSADEVEALAEIVGVGAVKYSLLKVARMQDISFDFEESVSFEGNSGPYVQYTYARGRSVIDKANRGNYDLRFKIQDLELNSEERGVLVELVWFGEVIERAAEDLAPHLVAGYVYELSKKFNSFYNKHSILGKNQDEVSNLKSETMFRIGLTEGVSVVLESGLKILGIDAPKRM